MVLEEDVIEGSLQICLVLNVSLVVGSIDLNAQQCKLLHLQRRNGAKLAGSLKQQPEWGRGIYGVNREFDEGARWCLMDAIAMIDDAVNSHELTHVPLLDGMPHDASNGGRHTDPIWVKQGVSVAKRGSDEGSGQGMRKATTWEKWYNEETALTH